MLKKVISSNFHNVNFTEYTTNRAKNLIKEAFKKQKVRVDGELVKKALRLLDEGLLLCILSL